MGLDLYDFEALPYTPAGLWFPDVDKKAADTPHISPYVYCAGDPVNKIDPDGQLMVFINGNHFGDGGSADYWDEVDVQIMNTTLDFHAFYYDGSIGGHFNPTSLSCADRIQAGYDRGYSEASRIISAASDENI